MEPIRNLLESEFKKRKERNANFSLRSFARWLGVSPAQLSQMMSGKRPVTLKTMKKISDRLGLSPMQSKKLMIALMKSEEPKEIMKEIKKTQLKEDQFRLIADWYHLAILSLSHLNEVQADSRWVARRLGISFEEANQALLRLERMGLLEIKPKFKQISEPFEVVSDLPSEAIRKYHKQNLSLAIEKVDTVENPLREFQSLSIPVHLCQLNSFRTLINDFMDQALELSQGEVGNEVYHLNVQFFPVTVIKE